MKATEFLKEEHKVIERGLDLLEKCVRRVRDGGQIPDGFGPWIIQFLRTLADRCHHAKEEDILFPLLETRGILRQGGPIGVMLSEHTIGRQCIRRMDAAISHLPIDVDAFSEASEHYTSLLRQHIFKENNVLFEMADNVLSKADDAKLMNDFQTAEVDHNGHELHARYEAELDCWESEFSKCKTA